MIIVKIKGGMGNQLFQYAAARRLAQHHNTELKLDLSLLDSSQQGYAHRDYELRHFCINASVASALEIAEITGTYKNSFEAILLRLRKWIGLNKFSTNVYLEHCFQFDPFVLHLPDNICLDGYWQSERYFKEIETNIREEFRFSFPLKQNRREIFEEIQGVNAVSLHVRRGDYVNVETASARHGACNLDYYLKAEDIIAKKIKSPYFFVFSDDPEWVLDKLKLRHPVRLVSYNSSCAHEELFLMSLCKHHVIANSSFSWWGAWLSAYSDKMVISPARWFNDISIDTNDLIPDGWMRL